MDSFSSLVDVRISLEVLVSGFESLLAMTPHWLRERSRLERTISTTSSRHRENMEKSSFLKLRSVK